MILIPTVGFRKQVTLESLSKLGFRDHVGLIVSENEVSHYPRDVRLFVPPLAVQGEGNLSLVFNWIRDELGGCHVVMDDDLTFAARRDDDPTKFESAKSYDIELMLLDMERLWKEGFPHVGVAMREGGNRDTIRIKEFGRACRVHAYDFDAVKRLGVQFDRVIGREDFDVTLQLLRMGVKTPILNYVVHNQSGSNSAGGCSLYRDDKMLEDSAHKLAELHPGLVRVVRKQTKTAWGGQERTDVVISWRKAYANS